MLLGAAAGETNFQGHSYFPTFSMDQFCWLMMRRARRFRAAKKFFAVLASEAKQSIRRTPSPTNGLLRFARKDGAITSSSPRTD
jgi:hypothetical protein